ncbi:MAG: ABC transporter permease subunit [Acidimicrobiia bacterium]|nr:ABC transporter permease subunit [Acidimicrobiia bacterium]
MITIIGHHLKQVASRRRILGLGALVLLPALSILLAGRDAPLDVVSATVVGLTGTVFGLATLILTAAVLRDERDDGTIHFIYLKPISRLQLAIAAWLAGVISSLLLAVICWLGIVASSALIGVEMNIATGTIVLLLLAGVGYTALFVPLGYLANRIILIGLAYLIIWEGIVATLIGGVANTSVWRLALSGYADVVGSNEEWVIEALGPVVPGVGGAVGKVAIVAALGIALLTWALRSRDAV